MCIKLCSEKYDVIAHLLKLRLGGFHNTSAKGF